MFIYAADTHLQISAWSGRLELAGDSMKAFQQIVDHTINSGATALVIGGDLLDCNRPPSVVVAFLLRQLDRLRERKIITYFVQGQHCRANPSWLSVYDAARTNALFLNSAHEMKGEKGVILAGSDHLPAESLQEELHKVPKEVTHLVLHQMMKPLIGWNFDLDWVPEHVKLVLLGDYHKRHSFQKAHYPGSTCMQAIDEQPDKYFFEVQGTKIKEVQLASRPFAAYVVTDEEGLAKAEKCIANVRGNEIGAPLVLVRCGFEAEKTFNALRKANPEAIFMFRALPTDKEVPIALSVEAPTLSECVDEVVNSEEEPELRSFLVEMLAAPDARDVIESKVPEAISANQ